MIVKYFIFGVSLCTVIVSSGGLIVFVVNCKLRGEPFEIEWSLFLGLVVGVVGLCYAAFFAGKERRRDDTQDA